MGGQRTQGWVGHRSTTAEIRDEVVMQRAQLVEAQDRRGGVERRNGHRPARVRPWEHPSVIPKRRGEWIDRSVIIREDNRLGGFSQFPAR